MESTNCRDKLLTVMNHLPEASLCPLQASDLLLIGLQIFLQTKIFFFQRGDFFPVSDMSSSSRSDGAGRAREKTGTRKNSQQNISAHEPPVTTIAILVTVTLWRKRVNTRKEYNRRTHLRAAIFPSLSSSSPRESSRLRFRVGMGEGLEVVFQNLASNEGVETTLTSLSLAVPPCSKRPDIMTGMHQLSTKHNFQCAKKFANWEGGKADVSSQFYRRGSLSHQT